MVFSGVNPTQIPASTMNPPPIPTRWVDRSRAFVLPLIAGLGLSLTAVAEPPQDRAPGHIIVFKENVNAQVAANELARHNGLQIGRVYRHAIKGAFVPTDLPPQALAALERNPKVAYVEANQYCHGSDQVLPTGIDRANVEDAVAIDGNDDLVDVDIAILDSGIDPTHPDLHVNAAMSVGFVWVSTGKGKSGKQELVESHDVTHWMDEHGHGSHVAGIAGAIDNDIGVVGVAPGARLTSVRVLDANNGGSLSIILAGMDYVAANADTFEVANMSIRGPRLTSMNDAVANITAAGTVMVVCAGNETNDAYNVSPASAPSAITVSALADTDGQPGGLGPAAYRPDGTLRGEDDHLATFSNFGEVVDVAAPGVDIHSTHLNGGYATLSGTSMASPHVAGAVALYIAQNGRDRDGNGVIDGNDVALMELLVRSTGWQLGDAEYFEGDVDGYPEPLLQVPNLLGYDIDQFPTVQVTSPADGAVVSGIVSLQATANDDHAVTQVEFFIDGNSLGLGTAAADDYSLDWDSTLVPDGTHEVSAVATDDYSQQSASSVSASVDNVDSPPIADAGPDQVVQDGDASGSESVVLDGSGSGDDRGIASYEWYEGASLLATGVSPTVDLPVGTHAITLVVVDSGGNSAQDSVTIEVEEGPPVGSLVLVEAIDFVGYGGKNGNNHMSVAASIRDGLGAAVAGAVVAADLYRNGSIVSSSTSTSDSSGSALLFDEKSIAAGCYDVVITNITAGGLTFDGITPANQYCK